MCSSDLSDAKNKKMTYVTLWGMEEAKKEVERLSEEALAILSSFGRENAFLEELIRRLITREK